MKAAVVTEFRAPLQIRDIATPEPGPGEVLVRVESSALCHTDIHAAHGDWPTRPTPPFVPGHEAVGNIEAIGSAVTTRALGDRVALGWLGFACGECPFCTSGRENLCPAQRNLGYSMAGAFAEYVVVPAGFATVVPAEIPSVEAAPLVCAGLTSYRAVKVGRVAPAERVAIFGIGGLGHLALQYARLAGAFTIAVDVKDHKLAMAEQLGADRTVNAVSQDPPRVIHAMGGADVAIALTASPESFGQAMHSLRPGGRLVCVALPAEGRLTVPLFPVVTHGLSILGSVEGSRADLADVFALHAGGRTRVIALERKLEEVNVAIGEVMAGDALGRIVFTL